METSDSIPQGGDSAEETGRLPSKVRTRPRIVECESTHEAMLTHPEAVARALVAAGSD
jgi:hypothetical protein